MLLSELDEDVNRVETSIVGELPWDDFKGLGKGGDNHLSWAFGIFAFTEGGGSQQLGKLHLNGTSTSNDGVGLDGSSDDHDGIVQ